MFHSVAKFIFLLTQIVVPSEFSDFKSNSCSIIAKVFRDFSLFIRALKPELGILSGSRTLLKT